MHSSNIFRICPKFVYRREVHQVQVALAAGVAAELAQA